MYDESQDFEHTVSWFYAGFIRSGTPSEALPNYARYAKAIYDLFLSEFGDDVPPQPVPPEHRKSWIIVAKGAGLFWLCLSAGISSVLWRFFLRWWLCR